MIGQRRRRGKRTGGPLRPWIARGPSAIIDHGPGGRAAGRIGTAGRRNMNTIDYIYRFDPSNPTAKPPPHDAEGARRVLEDGNRMFSRWMESCRTSTTSKGEPRYVVQCNGLDV